ncbi:hypothetical protein MSG28_013490 [Choristoneura fumiferana]|uniref:Uncharacterized protein n=3 Tax=Choristoneura fumiferana TaxID=7141 RepID=A0ACC0KU50_CHOFU|nr:hypothetical protein MSG28_013490 [Choristoneura fumiferana]
MKTQPIETTPCKAQPLDNGPAKGKAGPIKLSLDGTTHITWVPGMAKIINNIPITIGTLKQLINKGIQPSDKIPFTNIAGLLKQVVTGTTQPINKLLVCLTQPLGQLKMGVTQPFDKVPVVFLAGPLKWPIREGVERDLGPMNVGQLRPPSKSSVPIRHRVAMGCLSGMAATAIVHPLDVVKIRMQLYPKGRTNLQMLRRIVDCEGARALYAGLTAGLLRQLTYTSTRLAVYLTLLEGYQKSHGGKMPPLSKRLEIAILAGLAGAFAGTPSEVALIHMTVEGRQRRSACSPNCSLACKKVRKTGTAITMLYRLGRREGIRVLWRGATPTLLRSWFVSTAVVGSYGEIRRFLRRFNIKEGFQLHAYTAIFSCYITAVVSSPIDVVKTK